MNHQSAISRRTRTSGPERAAWAALPIITVLSLALAAGSAAAQTSGTTPSPFTTGMLSGVTGSTLAVQASNGSNTTVVVTGSTSYQQTTSATTSDLATGDCVRVSGTGSTTSGIHATTVAITKATSKGCTNNPAGFNARGGAGARRFGNRPPGGRTGFTLPGGGTIPTNIAAAFGSVTSISGQQLSVKAQVRPKNKKSKPKTDTVTVTLTGSTTLTQTQKAAETNLAVGSCVNAFGTVDSLGTITARTVTISQPVNGTCAGGFGGFGGFRGGAGGFGGGAGGVGGGTPTTNSTT